MCSADLVPADKSVPPEALEALGERIAELAANLDAGTYRLLRMLRAFDAQEGWARQGASSCAHWLAWRVGIGAVAARERVRVARALDALPRVSEALRRGEISYAKVRAITRAATAATEEALLTCARHGTAAQLEQIIRRYRRVTVAGDNARHAARGLTTRVDDDGMIVVQGRLTAEQGAALLRALELAGEQLPPPAAGDGDVSAETPAQPETAAQRRADALGLVAQSALDHALRQGTAADRTQVVLHVDAEALEDAEAPGQCGFERGADVSAETARRLCCDAAVVTVAHGDDGGVLDVGRKTRTVPPAIRRALGSRDGTCRFPGCDHQRFLQAHHVQHWADGGETRMDNLALLCTRHHRLVHEGGFGVRVAEDGELAFTRPDGRALSPTPPESVGAERAGDEVPRQNLGAGLQIDARTRGTWDGVPADYDMAVELLVRYEQLGRCRAAVHNGTALGPP